MNMAKGKDSLPTFSIVQGCWDPFPATNRHADARVVKRFHFSLPRRCYLLGMSGLEA